MLVQPAILAVTLIGTIVAIIIAAAAKNAAGGNSGKIKVAAIEMIAVAIDATAVVAADAVALINPKIKT